MISKNEKKNQLRGRSFAWLAMQIQGGSRNFQKPAGPLRTHGSQRRKKVEISKKTELGTQLSQLIASSLATNCHILATKCQILAGLKADKF